MVLVSPLLQPKACWEFEGDILVLHHPTTISPRYQAMGEGFTFNYVLVYVACICLSRIFHSKNVPIYIVSCCSQ